MQARSLCPRAPCAAPHPGEQRPLEREGDGEVVAVVAEAAHGDERAVPEEHHPLGARVGGAVDEPPPQARSRAIYEERRADGDEPRSAHESSVRDEHEVRRDPGHPRTTDELDEAARAEARVEPEAKRLREPVGPDARREDLADIELASCGRARGDMTEPRKRRQGRDQ